MLLLKGREAYQYFGDLEAKQLLTAQQKLKSLFDKGIIDEYFSAIENRDTELMEQRKLLEKKDNEIAENKEQLAKKDNEIAQKDSNLITAAKYMLECELPISKIMQATGLTDEQINSLKNNA